MTASRCTDLSNDMGSSMHGMLQLLKHHHPSALTDHKAVPALVKRARCLLWLGIEPGGQGLHAAKASKGNCINARLRAPCRQHQKQLEPIQAIRYTFVCSNQSHIYLFFNLKSLLPLFVVAGWYIKIRLGDYRYRRVEALMPGSEPPAVYMQCVTLSVR